MKSLILDFFLRLFAVFLSRKLPSKSAGILITLFKKVIAEIDPEIALRFLFEFENKLYLLEGKTSIQYGGGIHTKHKHIKYHDFFVKNIKPDENVLDIGSGNGFLSYDMATKIKGSKVTGIELNEKKIEFAKSHYNRDNLNFIKGNVLQKLPEGKYDVITLSNVLEHIKERVNFLKILKQRFNPKRFIIRVPLFERDWRVPLKKELGMDYRLDPTHFIEYTQEGFLEELERAGLKAVNVEYRWSEIWCIAAPIKKGVNHK